MKPTSAGLNPLACAVAAGCTELLAVTLVAVPMAGMRMAGGMMGGMMGGYALGALWWLGGAVAAALAGAVFALIHNALAENAIRTVK